MKNTDESFAIEVISPGAMTTIQDKGRTGYQMYGYRECGGCDRYSMNLANYIAGNTGNEAVLEMTFAGASVRFLRTVVFAFAGADMKLTLDGAEIPAFAPIEAHEGSVLTVGMAAAGLRGYLAVYGGIDVPLIMGSRSTDTACRIGGFEGRALKQGDRLKAGAGEQAQKDRIKRLRHYGLEGVSCGDDLRYPVHPSRFYGDSAVPVFRFVPGPQEDRFTKNGIREFSECEYTMQQESDRMGCRFIGEPVELKGKADIISDGILTGSVQIASSGQPIVMLADHQTTGGYAKIGTIIRSDLSGMAQLRPGDKAVFRMIKPEEAVYAARLEEWRLKKVLRKYRSGRLIRQ